MHRRKSSKEELKVDYDVAQVVPFPGEQESNGIDGGGGSDTPRARVNSVPSTPVSSPPKSSGPYRTSFNSTNISNGHVYPSSPFKNTFAHSRTLSASNSSLFRPPMSPLNGNYPIRSNSGDASTNGDHIVASNSMPFIPSKPQINGVPPPPSPNQTRRHSRIHSRNLSVFFPRPGSIQSSTIAEDEGQEVVVNDEASSTIIPSTSNIAVPTMQKPPGRKKFGDGFTFGGRGTSPSSASSSDGTVTASQVVPQAKRRGHRHKHTVSHNFFSFLEPGEELTPRPAIQRWDSKESLLSSDGRFSTSSTHVPPILHDREDIPHSLAPALATTIVQFLLGASLWVSGQQNGSLGCTGLGYWVVFDSFGVAFCHLLPQYLSLPSMKAPLRRTYGNARIQTLALFAQNIYLLFASVYVCKETVEHILLSLGNGHHHHRMDEETEGIQFPLFLFFITVVSLISTSVFYDNHSDLIRACGHRLPSLDSLFRFFRLRPSSLSQPAGITAILSNPYTLAPLFFTIAMLVACVVLPPSQHGAFDLLVAAIETVVTFRLAYPAAVVQGSVLLQTSPSRGMPGGRMEAFLRTMREIERHPLVLHLPAPHTWQLTADGISNTQPDSTPDRIIVTIELHVRKDLDDNEVISLTRWAHERVKLALSYGARSREWDGDAEVTVGIVRG